MGCVPDSDTKLKTKATYGYIEKAGVNEAVSQACFDQQQMDLRMQLELHFACTELKNVDSGSLTDSVVAVYLKSKFFL